MSFQAKLKNGGRRNFGISLLRDHARKRGSAGLAALHKMSTEESHIPGRPFWTFGSLAPPGLSTASQLRPFTVWLRAIRAACIDYWLFARSALSC